MPLSIPPDLKKITQYVRRAEELDKDKNNVESRLVAYYCRQYAIQQGIPILQTSPSTEGNKCLGTVMESLEKEKKTMSNFSKEESEMLCRKFANKVFDKADKVDRAGMANKSTAKSFYAAASFLDMLQQFEDKDGKDGESTEEEKKSFYAKWKATDILKAIKEGRDPTPGGYGEEGNDISGGEADDTTAVIPSAPPTYSESEPNNDIPPPVPDAPLPPPILPKAPEVKPSPPNESATDSIANFVGSFFGKPKSKVSKDNLDDAKELTKFALKALESKNTNLAAERLKEALSCLVEEKDS